MKLKYCIFIFCIGLSVFGMNSAKAQCNDRLVDSAIAKSGNDALFIREFIIKGRQKDKKKKTPALSTKYDIRLNKDIVYRFIVENEDNTAAQAFLQLRKDNIILASTYDTEKQVNIGNFDYLCEESGPYQVVLSFVGDNTACAAGAMFAIMQDSLSLATIMDSIEVQNVLYTGIDNFVDIAASNIPNGTLDVSISRGTISKEGGLYKVRVDEPGKLTIDVLARDGYGKLTETFKSEFVVMTPMLPTVTLAGNSGGLFKKTEILNRIPMLEIINYRSDLQFKIISFDISTKLSMEGINNGGGSNLSYRQINLIKDLDAGQTFYISNIKIEDSKGKVYQLEPLGFIIND
jgi:hypothetical protein